MKRGLKVTDIRSSLKYLESSNLCPDEKGTERFHRLRLAGVRGGVATYAPMKRGLKGLSLSGDLTERM